MRFSKRCQISNKTTYDRHRRPPARIVLSLGQYNRHDSCSFLANSCRFSKILFENLGKIPEYRFMIIEINNTFRSTTTGNSVAWPNRSKLASIYWSIHTLLNWLVHSFIKRFKDKQMLHDVDRRTTFITVLTCTVTGDIVVRHTCFISAKLYIHLAEITTLHDWW